ncbi:FAD-dependent oxidoreductase [Actinoplanes sp. CA-142083]|uniref:FAD-dependent oxidoreductase n=1 Tax=Actinoplanes sp. CA-142083 TaxID=3239903 RepID=UPI003D9349BD
MPAARRFAALSTSEPPTGQQVLLRQAVVLGGSVAGLMAARVLSDHAEQVLIVERDDLDLPGDEPRLGVPQGSQVHALLPSGLNQLKRWFPGFYEEALAAGAVNPPPRTNRFYLDGRLRQDPPSESPPAALISSRPFLESLIRQRVRALPNVRFLRARAEGLVFEGDAVAGVRLDGGEEPADFVVDATGRSSRLGDWLEANGFPKPEMKRMGIKLNYATALFRRPANPSVWSCISVANPGPGKVARIGGFTPIEGDRWTMLVSGYAGDRPDRDDLDFRRRCVEDFPPEFGEVATTAEQVGEVITYHQADSRRREFHRLRRFPSRLVAAGDAVASFNPVYGQGMTSAMLHASALSEYLRGDPDLARPARSYFADVKVIVDAAWQVSTMADLALPHVDGPYPRGYKAIQWISGRIFKASMRDQRVNQQLGKVTAMLAHPSALAEPRFLARALAIGARSTA